MTFTEFFSICPVGISTSYAAALYAHAILETGHFTSNVFKNANNMFGMKVASHRQQVGLTGSYPAPDGGSYASYSSLESSILDRISLDNYNGIVAPNSYVDIARYLADVAAAGYAADKSWSSKILSILKSISVDDVQLPDDSGSGGFKLRKWLFIVIPVILIMVYIWWKKRRV